MPQFTVDFWMSFLFATTGQACVGLGWNIGQILWKIETIINLRNCEKNLLYDICDLKSTWLGNSAQWLEKCT